MKKIFLSLIVLMLTCFICGCSSNKNIDLDKVYSNLESEYEDYSKVDKEVLEGNYGLDLDVFSDYLVVMSSDGTTSRMYAIFKTGDNKTDAEDEATYFVNKYYDSWDNDYFPEETKLVEDSSLETYGDYLIYIVNDDNDKIFDIIKNSN